MRQTSEKKEEGFSLVEVTVSLLIITILGFSFMGILYQATADSAFSSERLSAVHFSKMVLDYFKANPVVLDQVNNGEVMSAETFFQRYFQGRPVQIAPGLYQIQVMKDSATPVAGLSKVSVTVSWQNHSVTLTGYVEKGAGG